MYIIANPNSGKGNGAKTIAKLRAYLDERAISYTVHETTATGDGMNCVRKICAEELDDVIVAVGGDGTFHEVLNGIDFEKARMGLVPAGRGNDFAIGTGTANLDPVKAIADIVRGEPRELDYIQVSDKRCLNVAGTGLDVEVLLRTANSKNKLTYVKSLAKCLLHYKPYPVDIIVDGQSKHYDCIMVGVCNGTQIGGGIKLSPLSIADDGKLNIMIVEKPKHVATLFVMPQFVKGKHLGKSYVTHFLCDSIKIETPAPVQLDGEIYYDLDFDARVVVSGMKTFATSESNN